GVNLYDQQIVTQLKEAAYNIAVGSDYLDLAAFKKIVPQVPDVDQPLEFAVNIDGHLNDLQLQTFKLGIRDSYFNITGKVKNLINASKMHYTFQIDTLRLEKDDLKKLLKNTNNTLLNSLNNLKLAGFAEGSSDTLSLNIEAESPAGRFGFMGS